MTFRHSDKPPTYSTKYKRECRVEVLTTYGGACACCGEARFDFLTIFAPKGLGSATAKLFALLNSPRRQDVKLLCYNCRYATKHLGRCPHEAPR